MDPSVGHLGTRSACILVGRSVIALSRVKLEENVWIAGACLLNMDLVFASLFEKSGRAAVISLLSFFFLYVGPSEGMEPSMCFLLLLRLFSSSFSEG